MKLLAITNGTSSWRWRFEPIGYRMLDTEDRLFVTGADQWSPEAAEGFDAVILQLIRGANIVDTLHNLGKKVIFEADDAMIDTYGQERKNLTDMDPHHRTTSIDTIRKCDALTVTSVELAKNYARFTHAPIYVLPIYMDFRMYAKAIDMRRPKRNTDEIRLGWFGSKGHHEDLKMVEPAIAEILKRHPKVKFVYCGYGGASSDRLVTKVGWGEDAFPDLPRERREYVIGVDPEVWPQKHASLDLDIGICPLIDDEFNRSKVGTKWLEFSTLRTPTVCSPTVYAVDPRGGSKPMVQHGKTGFIAHDTKEWIEYLDKLVTNAALRKAVGDRAFRSVKKDWNVQTHWQDWIRVYETVLNS